MDRRIEEQIAWTAQLRREARSKGRDTAIYDSRIDHLLDMALQGVPREEGVPAMRAAD